ncbi:MULTISPECIES: ABC transporter permease [unclassified Burkholderia]|uniref:ABC transporter permease n=1 Tax=unclassified Burkholderia TaxID=2613784 RepID=UPI000F577BF6|nr:MULTISPECIES: ABC transporter permease [unclassified Burkholderia]RQR68196.1 histidine ABC transporter permease HisM [Burkholderia sp. Bp9012]RQR69480.1 histidine ABC transporter permease HisM [Burkholderia sp. Bp9011]RQR82386.1 histidine ABC transporter permease HisM [Burkholderia sp. Bp9010]RQZ38065.1 histidine ABC transporter permease HisM [Burkholderia sp. Bp9099]
MIDILNEFWRAFLYWDGQRFSGLAVTLWLLVASLFLGFILAVPLAVARISNNRFISVPVWCYTYVFRGTPLYVQLLLIYTGLYGFEFVRSAEILSAVFRSGYYCSIIAFALNTCAYTTEMFAGAMRTTNHGEIEAARAYGMSWFTMYRQIVIPSALRRALPLYSNEVILMLHATSVAFTATVPDILKVARDANSATYQSFQSFGIAALLYLVVSFSLVTIFRQAERRWLAYLSVRSR